MLWDVSPHIDEEGEIAFMNSIARDITQRNRMEQALRESEEKFRTLFENMRSGSALHEVILDEQGKPVDYRYLDVNPAFEEQVGRRREELVGRRVTEVFLGFQKELEQVLINLIANARDAYQGSSPAAQEIRLEAWREGERLMIRIEDDAGGIPEPIIHKIFDPYFSTKEVGKGTGIGLYMSRNIIEQSFGGSISVENRGEGARFTLSLPDNDARG